MSGEQQSTGPMSLHGKNKQLEKAMQRSPKLQSLYDYDGLLSSPLWMEIKTYVTLPPLPSMDTSWWDRDGTNDWFELADCVGQTKLFFEHRCSVRCDNHDFGCDRLSCVREAKEICKTCPVLEHCRIWAIQDTLYHGIAGAMSERERSYFRATVRGEKLGEKEASETLLVEEEDTYTQEQDRPTYD